METTTLRLVVRGTLITSPKPTYCGPVADVTPKSFTPFLESLVGYLTSGRLLGSFSPAFATKGGLEKVSNPTLEWRRMPEMFLV
jgi:hypothetical protein